MEFTAENLEKVVTVFYGGEAGPQHAEAHQWLNEAQNSPQAWSFLWELLDPNRSLQVQFFGACTLHNKLRKQFPEVPQDHYEQLKRRILNAIVSYSMGPKLVLNTLCLSMGAYIIHTVPMHWPNAFEELLSSFQPQHLPGIEPERVIWILLEILTNVPEEILPVNVVLGQRNRVQASLLQVSKDILKFVEMCLMPIPANGFEMCNLTTYMHAAKCAHTWLQLGGVTVDELHNLFELLVDLTCFVYWNRGDPECLSGDELEVMEACCDAMTVTMGHALTHKFPNSIVKQTASILYKFDQILDTERNCSEINKDVIRALSGLIIDIADAHTKVFLENLKMSNSNEKKMTFDLISCVLKCTDLPGSYPVDETTSITTLNFWYTLQDEILALDTVECAQLLLMIKPLYKELVVVLLRKSLLPINENQWSLDDKERFRCYRQDIADTFMYCYNFLNLEMLDILTTKLDEALTIEANGNPSLRWNEIETCLHAFAAVGESVELENLYIPKLMLTLKNIPFDILPVKVLTTALETMSSYAEWLAEHSDMLEHIFPLIISNLNNVKVATSSTMALKDISGSCQKFLAPYAESILMSAQTALQNGNLNLSECRRLMLSIGKVLSIMPADRIMEYLTNIVAPTFNDMNTYLASEVNPTTAACLMSRLKVLSALFNSLYIEPPDDKPQAIVEQPIHWLLQTTMPLYKQISEKYYNNVELVVDLTALLKYGITNLKDDCKPLVTDILDIVVRIYRGCPQGQILIIAETILTLFGKDPDMANICKQLVIEISSVTLQACGEYHDKLAELSDILESYFNMMSKIIKKSPQLFNDSEINLTSVFECAVICLVLPETQTVRAISSFLVNFITHSRDIAKPEIVQTLGESLVLRMLLNMGSTMPRTSVEVLGDIFLALNKKYCDNLSRWLNTLLAQENFPSPRVSAGQKQAFIKLILREKANKRKVNEAVLELTLICKGVIVTPASAI